MRKPLTESAASTKKDKKLIVKKEALRDLKTASGKAERVRGGATASGLYSRSGSDYAGNTRNSTA